MTLARSLSFGGNRRLRHVNDAPGEFLHLLERRGPRRFGWSLDSGFHRFLFRFGPRFNCGFRLASRRSWGEVCPGQSAIGEPLPKNRINHGDKSLAVTCPPIIEAEDLFAQVAWHMERVYGNVGAPNGPLQQTP